MIITKPEKIEDLYPLFKQILIEKHKPDKAARWGLVTFTGKGFYLNLSGDYKYDYVRKTIDIEHPDEYFLDKFRNHDVYSETVYLDRYITLRFSKDMKGQKHLWSSTIYQHE